MNLLITTSSFDVEGCVPLESLTRQGWSVTVNPLGRRLTESEVSQLARTHEATALLAGVEPLTARVFDENPQIRFVSRVGTGIDNVDLDAAAQRQIHVMRTPDAPSPAVAELTLGLMLAALRHIGSADRDLRAGQWVAHQGRLLARSTVGIVGYGRVGRRVARLCAAFGASVLACDPFVDDVDVERCATIDELCSRVDVLSLHAALRAGEDRLIGWPQLRLLGADGVLVNAARGGLVDESALVQALGDSTIAFAALDVFEDEPYAGPLAKLPNTLLTCHMGSKARETRSTMEHEAAQNLLDALDDTDD